MNIFMKEKSFSVNRIEKLVNGWNLYSVENREKPIFISKDNYSGKLPPSFKWPWQQSKLEIIEVNDFIVRAILDGITLFEIPEADYPPESKKMLAKGKNLCQEVEAACEVTDNIIKAALAEYLLTIPLNPNLEDDLSKFHVCLRVYLKLHLFEGIPTEDNMRRLNLMYLLFEIVARIYKRHVNTDESMNISLAAFRFGNLLFGSPYPDYRLDIKEIENAVKDEIQTDVTLSEYYEVEGLIEKNLPEIKHPLLMRYLNYTVREVLQIFSIDYSEFNSNLLKDAWSNKRLCTDERDYQYQYANMKMLKYKSYIISDVFADEKLKYFISNYNLK